MEMLYLLTNATSTFLLTGLIWMVQIVHYPLLQTVGSTHFRAYHRAHTTRISWLVGPAMTLELISALLLYQLETPPHHTIVYLAGLLLVVFLWVTTAFVQIPLHQELSIAPTNQTLERLVQTNWIRTSVWTSRSALLFGVLLTNLSS